MLPFIAQAGLAFQLGHLAIVGIVVVAIVLILLALARLGKINPPPELIYILWVVLGAVIACYAIWFLIGLL